MSKNLWTRSRARCASYVGTFRVISRLSNELWSWNFAKIWSSFGLFSSACLAVWSSPSNGVGSHIRLRICCVVWSRFDVVALVLEHLWKWNFAKLIFSKFQPRGQKESSWGGGGECLCLRFCCSLKYLLIFGTFFVESVWCIVTLDVPYVYISCIDVFVASFRCVSHLVGNLCAKMYWHETARVALHMLMRFGS